MILEWLKQDVVLGDGGTLFELERRGYVSAGPFTPEVSVEHPQALKQLQTDFARAGAQVIQAFTYYAHEEKLKAIEDLSKDRVVLSEVGTKVKGLVIPNDVWVTNMKSELDAGAWKVIAEARESGTIGIYNADGSANRELIDDIMKQISVNEVIWEAPNKAQQVMFIKLIGANVNLGNIAPHEVVALEALRRGMRGDTFFDYLPSSLQERKL